MVAIPNPARKKGQSRVPRKPKGAPLPPEKQRNIFSDELRQIPYPELKEKEEIGMYICITLLCCIFNTGSALL